MLNYWENIFAGNGGYYYDLDKPSRKAILDYLGAGDSVLDLGCGGGALRAILPAGHRYLGMDYAPTAIKLSCERFPDTPFMVGDARRDLAAFKDNEYDIVVMRHFLENQEDWRTVVKEAFRVANKKVIIVMRRPFINDPSKLLESPNDTFVWDINHGEFNMLARHLSVNVSYGKVQDEEVVVIGKHLDKVVFDLDDFHDTNHNLPLLLDLKRRFPNLKVTLFCIPSKCSIPFIQSLKDRYGQWMEFAVHGWHHDTEHGTAQESNYWTKEEANHYLQLAEDMGIFVKGFRAPGWNINHETYEVLAERGYWVADHKDHDRWVAEIKLPRYTTGHLAEVHGHIQQCNMNGLLDLATVKCNFHRDTTFRFVSEALDTSEYLPNAY